MCEFIVAIIGLGFVGSAMFDSFVLKGMIVDQNLFVYDKYKNGGIGSLKQCLQAQIVFLALPTVYNHQSGEYDKAPIYEVCQQLENDNYQGVVVIKSTVEPETTNQLSGRFTKLQFIHNPEFLSAKSAFNDFHSQKHVVLGQGLNCSDQNLDKVKEFYEKYYIDNPDFEISLCTALESESMKIFANCFYSIKIQAFTEFYCLCQKNNANFETIRTIMLKNRWINPMHTQVPGSDGLISYGGYCFPKDTNALFKYMEKKNVYRKVLGASIEERNEIRNDQLNCHGTPH